MFFQVYAIPDFFFPGFTGKWTYWMNRGRLVTRGLCITGNDAWKQMDFPVFLDTLLSEGHFPFKAKKTSRLWSGTLISHGSLDNATAQHWPQWHPMDVVTNKGSMHVTVDCCCFFNCFAGEVVRGREFGCGVMKPFPMCRMSAWSAEPCNHSSPEEMISPDLHLC